MIREGLASDMDDVVRIRTSVRENHLSVEQMAAIGITPQTIIADVTAGHLGFWVAEDEGRVIGFAMADRREGEVFALFMDAAHEGKGHGTTLLERCEVRLRHHGLKQAKLGTGRGTVAHAFYLRRGWRLTSEKSGHFAEDDVLRKSL